MTQIRHLRRLRPDPTIYVSVLRKPTQAMIECGLHAMISSHTDERAIRAIWEDMTAMGAWFDGHDRNGAPYPPAKLARLKHLRESKS